MNSGTGEPFIRPDTGRLLKTSEYVKSARNGKFPAKLLCIAEGYVRRMFADDNEFDALQVAREYGLRETIKKWINAEAYTKALEKIYEPTGTSEFNGALGRLPLLKQTAFYVSIDRKLKGLEPENEKYGISDELLRHGAKNEAFYKMQNGKHEEAEKLMDAFNFTKEEAKYVLAQFANLWLIRSKEQLLGGLEHFAKSGKYGLADDEQLAKMIESVKAVKGEI